MSVLCGVAIAAALAAGSAALGPRPAAAAPQEIVFLTWADYLDPAIVEEFEREHGVKLRFAYFESDDARDEMLANADGRGYDLVLVSGLRTAAYAERGWLAPIPERALPNLAHLEPRWRTAFPASERYAVPYFWGTLGIAYRRDLVPKGFSTWKEFFAPDEALRGRIAMLKNSRDVVGMALKALGHSANSNDRAAIRDAARLLAAQKPYVRSYEYVSLNEESALVSGEIWASLMYSGDALMVREHNDQIAYVVPEEGTNLWVDYIAVLESSPRKPLAAKLIDFLNRPEIAARNAEFVHYATPNRAARAHLPQEYLDDEVIHPNAKVLARSEVYRDFQPRTQKTVNSLFAQLVN